MMTYSYEGIGQWAASFAATGAEEGAVVRPCANGSMTGCAAGEPFCGVVLYRRPNDAGCTVQLSGLAAVRYSGAAPTAGLNGLSADGSGGVKADASGTKYWVMAVDETAGTVTFKL